MAYLLEGVLSQQVPEEHGVMNNGEQVNDHVEEDDHNDNYGINVRYMTNINF